MAGSGNGHSNKADGKGALVSARSGELVPQARSACLSVGSTLAEQLEILRGDHDETAAMEILQIGYLHAVASASRCSLADPRPDRRLDWTIHHPSDLHTVDNEVDLKVALKATSQSRVDPTKPFFSFTMENAHLKYLNFTNPSVHKILIVMCLPRNIDEWIEAAHDYLAIRHCCYWVNLAGVEATGANKTNVRVPTHQVFDDKALCAIMQRIGVGGKP